MLAMPSTLARQFRDQAIRLMRTSWDDANMLGQELYTVLLSVKDDTTGPVSVSPTPDGANPFTLPPFPNIDIPPIDLNFPDLPANTQQDTKHDNTDKGPLKPPGVPGGDKVTKRLTVYRSAIPGKVVSGSGSVYVVSIYPNGLLDHSNLGFDGTGQSRDVVAYTLEQDDAMSIESGTWVSPVYRLSGVQFTETIKNTVTGEDRRTSIEYLFIDHFFKKPSEGVGGGIPCKILSGTGDTYLVDLYENGVDKPATKQVEVIQLQIDEAEQIPEGTWTFASKIKERYYVQVSVWL